MLLRQKVTATSDGMGNVTFTFPQVPVNQAWTGSFAIPSAPASAAFVLNLETGEHGGWGGPTPWGPLRLSPSELAVITGSGLTPSTSYTAVLIGDQAQSGVLAGPYPAPQTGNSPIVPGSDVLATSVTVAFAPTVGAITTGAVPGSYETIMVAMAATTASTSVPVAAQVQNITTGVFSAWQSTLLVTGSDDTPFQGPLYFPIPTRVNDLIRVRFLTLDGSSPTVDVGVEGLGAPIEPSPLRSDGRLMPAGAWAALSPISASSTFNLVAAPTTPARVLLSSAVISPGSVPTVGPNIIGIACTVKGKLVVVRTGIYTNTIMFDSDLAIPPEGLLCDPATAVVGSAVWDGAVGITLNAVYDLVL